MPDPSSDHVRRPRQERSRKTLERIAGAALELFAERGVEATSVHEIVERADSSVGSFYARFDGKESLVRFLEERVWARARERWDRALEEGVWDERSLEEVVRGLVASLAALQEADAAQRGALRQHARSRGEPDPEEPAFHRHVEAGVRRLLLERREAIRHPEPETAASIAYRWILGGLREVLGRPTPDGSDRIDRETLVEELSRGLLAYLGAREGGSREEEGVEFFDVWQ